MACVYFLSAKLGLGFAYVHPSATAIWPPAGITLAAFLVLGVDVWPAILLGAFFANLTTHGSVATSLCIGIGNTFEGLAGALLVTRFANGRYFFRRPRDIVKFALLAAILSTTISATIGLTSLAVGGYAPWAEYGHIWLTWWLGDSAAVLVVAPVLVLWATRPSMRWNARLQLEGLALIGGLSLIALIVFDGLLPQGRLEHLPVEFLCVPFLFWAAFRLGRRAVATCVLVLAFIAIYGTLHGMGPFAHEGRNESLLLLQAYLAVQAVTMLAAAAVVWERRQAEEQSRRQAVRDELTGLANYRFLMSSLEGEIKRARRANRGFALLLVDMDGLKQINDSLGHVVGNRALFRVGECLKDSCRTTDTAARFGGDEFSVLLPETGEEGARQLVERVHEHLAEDSEYPRLSVSIGIAVFPRDGASPEKLLNTADQELYRTKNALRDATLKDASAVQG
ncbi:MAG TPA: MASE1 domain-containing protein [Candidatus Dormibacteraeota bacterium]|nr:MASE1 domain-containing protein [Candidatus Dormibacteraeota bacterium]